MHALDAGRGLVWFVAMMASLSLRADCMPADRPGGAADERPAGDARPLLYGLPFEPESDAVVLFGSTPLRDVVQAATSQNGDWIAVCRVVENGDVDLFKMHRSWVSPQRVTETPAIEFDPDIDDQGRVAYACHDHRVDRSTLVFEGTALTDGSDLCKATRFVHGLLFAHRSRLSRSEDEHWLGMVDLENSRLEQVASPLIISRIDPLGVDQVLVTGHLVEDGRAATAIFDPQSRTFSTAVPVAEPGGSDVAGTSELRSCLTSLAARHLLSNDPLNNLSKGNNHLGRLSWKAGSRLGGLVDLLEAGVMQIAGLSVERLAESSARSLMRSASWRADLPGWPTRKYSMSRQADLDLLVNNAAVLYPLVRLVNSGHLHDPALKSEVVRMSSLVFERNEPLFDASIGRSGGYRFRKGVDYQHDGICLPFNQQNLWGATLLELHRATGEDRYRRRAVALAETFRAEMWLVDAERLAWNYWPDCFLQGWTADAELSRNTPSRQRTLGPWFEDYSHSGINVEFAVKISEHCAGEVFSESDLRAMRSTLIGMKKSSCRWSHRIAGGSSEEVAASRFRPGFGWVALAPGLLAEQHLAGAAAWYPYFEDDPFNYVARILRVLQASEGIAVGAVEPPSSDHRP